MIYCIGLFAVGYAGLILNSIYAKSIVLTIILACITFGGLLGAMVCDEKQNDRIKKLEQALKEREGNG